MTDTQQMEEKKQVSVAYSPGRLLDVLIVIKRLKNDVRLPRLLQVVPPVICKFRNRTAPLTSSVLIRMHEETGLSIADLRMLMGDRREKTRVSNETGKNAGI